MASYGGEEAFRCGLRRGRLRGEVPEIGSSAAAGRLGEPGLEQEAPSLEKSTANSPRYALTLAELARLLGVSPMEARERLQSSGGDVVGGVVAPTAVRALLEAQGVDYSFRVIGNVNLRGGVGKTTCTVTTASRAAQYGFRTCLLDLDAQGSASLAFDRMPGEEDPIFYDLWQKPEELLEQALLPVDEFLDILPSTLENSLLDVGLSKPAAQKNAVRGVCRELKAMGYDLVVIDCPPSLGAAVISTICASDLVVIPVWSDPFSFKGLDLALQEMAAICETFGLERPEVKVLYARHDRREKLAKQALETLRENYADLFVPTVIGTSTEFSKALARRESIFASRRASPAKANYDAFIRHLLSLEELGAEQDHGRA